MTPEQEKKILRKLTVIEIYLMIMLGGMIGYFIAFCQGKV